MMKLFHDEKRNVIFRYLTIFYMIYFGRDTLVTSTFVGFLPCYIILACLLAVYALPLLKNILLKKVEYKKKLIHFSILVFLILLSMVINNAYTFMYISIIFAIVFSYVLSFYYTTDELLRTFSRVMMFLVIYSFVATFILDKLIQVQYLVNAANMPFNNLLFCFVPIWDGYVRIFSIFREPGVYQIFLLMGIYYIIIYKNAIKTHLVEFIILSLGLISTFSVSGYATYVVLLCMCFLKYCFHKEVVKKKTIYRLVTIISVFLVVMVIAILSSSSISAMFNNMLMKVVNLGSDHRIESIIQNVLLFSSSPIKGYDINYVLTIVEHNTSTLFSLFAIFGVCFGLIYTYMSFKFFNLKVSDLKAKTKTKALIKVLYALATFVFVILILNNQCMITNIFLYLFFISNIYDDKCVE